MKIRTALLTITFISTCILSIAAQASDTCPDLTLGETPLDCPWASEARKMTADSQGDKDLSTDLPALSSMIARDSQNTALLSIWGQSINFDELVHGVVVDPSILNTLYALAHVARPDIQDSHVLHGTMEHAGLEHTYGYLFSVLKTAFGYKRARWVKGETELGFGFLSPTFSPLTSDGTLLSNVSYFSGKIAFRKNESALKLLDSDTSTVAPSVLAFDYTHLSPLRVEEEIHLNDRTVILRTDIVPFFRIPSDAGADQALLVYSVADSQKGESLVTAFPVGAAFIGSITRPETLGENQPIATHYNAYVEGVSGVTLTGIRRIIQPEQPEQPEPVANEHRPCKSRESEKQK